MKQLIAACGNDCMQCPRHLPKSPAELEHTAELWLKIGYRDRLVSSQEIACSGCKAGNWCRYEIIDCTAQRGIKNCGECSEYPCGKIKECFRATDVFTPACREACSAEEYTALHKAFFEKEQNLDKLFQSNK